MPDDPVRRSLSKRILLVIGGFAVFTLLFMIATRLAVLGIFRGIETNKATGLAAISPFSVDNAALSDLRSLGSDWISRSAALQMHAGGFEASVRSLNNVVDAHHGYLEDLRTQSR